MPKSQIAADAAPADTTPTPAQQWLAALLPPPPPPRPRLTPAEIEAALASMAELSEFREQLAAKYGTFPDSTFDIAADRRRDD